MEQHRILQPFSSAIVASAVAIMGTTPIPALLQHRLCPLPIPSVQVVDLSSDDQKHEKTKEGGLEKRKAGEEGGQGPSEEERDATIKFVVDELKSELFIELTEGFPV
jgi:hypothetical protein